MDGSGFMEIQTNQVPICSTLGSLPGHVISKAGISTDPSNITAIWDWPQPRAIKELCGFLRSAVYYRKFVRTFSLIAKPLSDMLHKDVLFV